MGLINSKRNERDEVKYSNPNGLYPTCSWDIKTVKKLILEKKLAPFYPGSEEKSTIDHDECPICFLYYTGGLNNSRCCKKGMCTECFLQIKKPNTPLSESTCPFCNRTKFTVVFTGPKTQEERQKEEEEEQRVVQLQQKMREEEIERDKERERQRQALKGKDKEVTKPDSSDKDHKLAEPAREDEPKTSEGGKGKPAKAKNKKKTGRNEPEQRTRYKSLPGTSEPAGPAPVPENSPIVLPSSYPPPTQGGGGSSPEKDLEEIMLMEAIRLSLIESTDKQSPRSAGNPAPAGPEAVPIMPTDEGRSSPFSELFGGVESEGNDFETRVKGGIVTRTTSRKTGDKPGSFSTSESDSEDEKEKEKGGNDDAAGVLRASRRGRTSSTTVPIEETPLGSLEGN